MSILDFFKRPKNELREKFKQELVIEKKFRIKFKELKKSVSSFFDLMLFIDSYGRIFINRVPRGKIDECAYRIHTVEIKIMELHALTNELKQLASSIKTYTTASKSRGVTPKLTFLEAQTLGYIERIEEEISKLMTITQEITHYNWKKEWRNTDQSTYAGYVIVGMIDYYNSYNDLFSKMENNLLNLLIIGKEVLKRNDFSTTPRLRLVK